MRTVGAILIKHRLSVSVLAIAALTATACATSNDSAQPVAPTETQAATASHSTAAPPETPPPEVSATQPPTTTTKPPITTTTSFSTTAASDSQLQTATSAPVEVENIADAIGVNSAREHTCAVHADGTVSCWGSNGSGQLGDGTTDDSATPVKVTGITDAISVAVDHEYSCAIHADRSVSCWGSNLFGILGYYLRSDDYDFSISPVSLNRVSLEPIRVPEVSGAMSLHTNSQFLCALRIDNTATCWGYDKYGVFNCLHDNFSMWLEGSIGRDDKYSVPDCRAETCPHSIYIEGLEANPENEGWPVCSTLPTELIYTRKITSMSTQVGFICVTHTDTTVFCWGYDEAY